MRVLNNIDLAVASEEIVGLIGPNGAGKTTLFNIISGLTNAESGTVTFNNWNITDWKPERRAAQGIGRTYQIPRPFAEMTVLDNVTVAVVHGKKKISDLTKARLIAYDWLVYVGLAKKSHVLVEKITLADRKRLELARALAQEPKLLLLDEIFSGLNPAEAEEAMNCVKRARSELKVSVLIIEHVVRTVTSLSDRIVVLDHGNKIADSSPSDIVRDIKVIEAYLGDAYAQS